MVFCYPAPIMFALPWNPCSASPGITVRLALESLFDLHWNTHHPDLASAEADDPLLQFLLEQIDRCYDPSQPVESAKDALKQVVLALFVMLNALCAL